SMMAARQPGRQLKTFSIGFAEDGYDELEHARKVAKAFGTDHHELVLKPDVVSIVEELAWYLDEPFGDTSAIPTFMVSELASEHVKVVLTGEGADELFLGYDLFKEVAVRQFCLRHPESQSRQRLFDRLYPYLAQAGKGGEFWRKFFLEAGTPKDPLFSHMPRFLLSARIKDFYAPEFRRSLGELDVVGELRSSLPTRFYGWSSLNRAAYLEMTTLLSTYLLSSQGDRMAMAHGVEGRFPFLDHRLFEFSAALPTSSRLLGLREKEILRRWAKRVLPPRISTRGKQPYRAPDAPSFFAPGAPDWIADELSNESIRRVGIFSTAAVDGLVRRCRAGAVTGFRENQAIVGILSTQVWHRQFVEGSHNIAPLPVSGASLMFGDSVPAFS
ncbi:MAG TPA: asparagine synthase C-terminal domain-containing protein, partial [Gemmatimonadaceae bacterium]|nr:asparagine synthase C-terminal domain-containing protein [Gemmatimonadaceae bacterium]